MLILRFWLWRSTSSRASTRISAALKLGRLPRAEAVTRLIQLLGDPDPSVREVAARSLRPSRTPAAIEPLIEAVRNGVTEAMWTLGETRDRRAIRALVEALPSQMPSPLAENFPGWEQTEEARLAVPALLRWWKDGSSSARLTAVQCLATLRDPRAVEPLIASLAGGLDYVDLRRAALRALGTLEPEWFRRDDATKMIPALAKAAVDTPGCEASRAALQSIASAWPEAMVKGLGDDRYYVRHAADEALQRTLPSEAATPLVRALDNPSTAFAAAGLLEKLVASAQARIAAGDLRLIAGARDAHGTNWVLTYSCQLITGDRGIPAAMTLERTRQLARQELIRRGEED